MTRSTAMDRDKKDRDAITENVRRLSKLLTRERDRLPAEYLRDAELRSAYRAYFLPANIPKVHTPLAELSCHPAGLLAGDRLKVLDIGTGPGTSVFGILTYFGRREHRPVLEFTAVDHVAENLREAAALFPDKLAQYGGKASLDTMRCDAEEAAARLQQRFDVIVLSNVLNELFAGAPDRTDRRVRLVSGILQGLLDEGGSCIVIEPALRETSRDLLLVRDGLCSLGFTVYSPCLMQAPCPAIAVPKDWCHEDRPWNAPAEVIDIDRRAGLRKHSLKFSYLVLRRDGRSLADPAGAGAMRVVSEPLVSKGKREYYVCGDRGRRLVVRMDKDASLANAAFASLLRGTIVRFEGLKDEVKRFRVEKDTAVAPVPVPRFAGDRP